MKAAKRTVSESRRGRRFPSRPRLRSSANAEAPRVPSLCLSGILRQETWSFTNGPLWGDHLPNERKENDEKRNQTVGSGENKCSPRTQAASLVGNGVRKEITLCHSIN